MPATAVTYASATRRFSKFCQQIGVLPVPAAQHTRLQIQKAKSDLLWQWNIYIPRKDGLPLATSVCCAKLFGETAAGKGPLMIWGDRFPLCQDRFV